MTAPSDEQAREHGVELSYILKMMPHRYPFMLVDRVIRLDRKEKLIIAKKNVTFNEQFFQGHFPDAPIMPGVLILEALAQTGGILLFSEERKDKISVFLNANNVKFRNPVRPGDTLMLQCETVHESKLGGKVKARATVDDKVACQAEIGFAYVDRDQV